MIIFGFRTMVKFIATVNLVCGNCHNPVAQQVARRMRWFTLFFIPVFPVSVSRSMTCTYCGVTTKLSKTEAEQVTAGTPRGDGPRGPHGPGPTEAGIGFRMDPPGPGM
ncbi:zinc-ribbon domain-containing protein [Jatrophihabitans sp. YIM 134969]